MLNRDPRGPAALLRAHRADLGSVDALRRMIRLVEEARDAEARVGPLAEHFDRHRHLCTLETFDHELLRLEEQEADLLDDLEAIREEGGPAVPPDYRAPRADRS